LARKLLLLTFVTGVVDAVSVLGFGRVFTANMTGNVVFLAFGVAGAAGFSVARSLFALVAFLGGAAIGGRLGSQIGDAARAAWLRIAFSCEAALLFTAALVSIRFNMALGSPVSTVYLIIGLTAVAMGLRNATVRRLAVPDLTTTVLTLTLTGIAADSTPAGGTNPRIARRTASVVLRFAGAVTGVFLMRLGPALPLLLSGALVLVTIPGLAKGEQ
jgi:uncharacterized membrane protein YoaK (UPF0700 family)